MEFLKIPAMKKNADVFPAKWQPEIRQRSQSTSDYD